MALCQTCHTDDARPTKTECWPCYNWRRSKRADGSLRHPGPRSEEAIIRNNQRRFERETERNNWLC